MTISHIDMPVALSRTARTTFGAPMLDDYGMDDLSLDLFERSDALLPDVRASIPGTLAKGEPNLIAVLDPDAPAKTVRKGQPIDEPSRTLIEPDMQDAGMTWWIGDDAIVACPIEMVTKALDVAERGSFFARMGEFPCERGFMVQPLREELIVTGMALSKHKAQHDEWRAVLDTITKEA